jgi:hypothetical protein
MHRIAPIQYDIDSKGNLAKLFHYVRDILLSYPQLKEIKNAKQTSYHDEYGVVVMMRVKDGKLVVAFGRGVKMQEKFSQLTGSGKVVRHLRFKSINEVDEKLFRKMLKESFVLGVEADEMKHLRSALKS